VLPGPPAPGRRRTHRPELQAKSLHLGSLGWYVQFGEETSAQVTADADPRSTTQDSLTNPE
jgi:hypothetical protein